MTEGDYCYKMEYNTRTDSDPFAELWSEAEMSCNRLGATLASVHSQLENDGIKNYTDGLLTWIGLVGFSKLHRVHFTTIIWVNPAPPPNSRGLRVRQDHLELSLIGVKKLNF